MEQGSNMRNFLTLSPLETWRAIFKPNCCIVFLLSNCILCSWNFKWEGRGAVNNIDFLSIAVLTVSHNYLAGNSVKLTWITWYILFTSWLFCFIVNLSLPLKAWLIMNDLRLHYSRRCVSKYFSRILDLWTNFGMFRFETVCLQFQCIHRLSWQEFENPV